MYLRKQIEKQITASGLRLGDTCSIVPFQGKRKAFTLNRHCIDLVSKQYRPRGLSLSYFELPQTDLGHFHYRLELDPARADGRFLLKSLSGQPFWLNGLAAKEAYIERLDRAILDDNRLSFEAFDLQEKVDRHFDHPVLREKNLLTSDLRILIQGETGTGKSHLARSIHDRSERPGKFVGVNLSSFNPQLIESELFGHTRGAFTGALAQKDGAFHEALQGTLFLDEIDSLPLELQTKLLTFLDSGSFRRVGEVRESRIQTRLIFAAGRSLENLVQQGVFRRDFYFRLKAGHSVELMPLRNSPAKITEACQHFALKNHVSFTCRVLDFYETLAWPGNLRQLFGHLEKKKVLCRSTKLDFDHLDEELLLKSSDLMQLPPSTELLSMKEHKEVYVKKALSICEGNVSLAARRLRVTEKTVKSILAKIS